MNQGVVSNYLFVYGTLRKDAEHEMYHVLERNAEYVGEGRMKGVLYQVDNYPGAISVPEAKSYIKGEIYKINKISLTLKKLDRYEEYYPDSKKKSEFKRRRVLIQTNVGKKIKAWTYVYARPVQKLKRITSGDFLKASKVR